MRGRRYSPQVAAIRDGERGGVLPAIEPPYALSHAVASGANCSHEDTNEASQLDKSWLNAGDFKNIPHISVTLLVSHPPMS